MGTKVYQHESTREKNANVITLAVQAQEYIFSLYTANSRKVVEKTHKSARDKTERWSGYLLEFCLLA